MAEFPLTRASLLVRLRDPQDQAAWAQFVDLYAPLVYGYARKQGLQDADAADLSQDVFGAVAAALSHFEYDPGRGAFHNWLLTIVRHKLANWRRARRSSARKEIGDENGLALQALAAPHVESNWEVEWEERVFEWACAQVRQDVEDRTWQAFWRTAIEDQPGKKVALDLGLSVAAVYAARSRVLARLKECVQSVQEPE